MVTDSIAYCCWELIIFSSYISLCDNKKWNNILDIWQMSLSTVFSDFNYFSNFDICDD